ncbi:MAG: hypothetical protein CFH06_02011 [Alphaproteobacteria bacterium MarineAlpha3_Bin5]|nr:MAG: hypothetical protein CFH06_02011 [Alphaproteobacteria bacterium MarineAlpha3_Bin5]
MVSRSSDNKKPTSDRPEEPKERNCLMCNAKFISQHRGERVCSACKASAAWREASMS